MAKNGKVARKEQVHILLSKHEKAVVEQWARDSDRSVTASIRLLLAANIDGFKEPTKLPGKTVRR